MANYKKFLYISGNTEGKKWADLKSEVTSPAGKYYKTIVFVAETNELWNRGKAYGLSAADAARITNLESAVAALEAAQVKVKAGEKIIGIDADKVSLYSTLALAYDSTNKKIQIKGINNAVVTELDATAFIKDGMINTVELVKVAESGVTEQVPYLKITFNTDAGKDVIRTSVKDLVDVYTGSNDDECIATTVENNVIKATIKNASIGTGKLDVAIQQSLTNADGALQEVKVLGKTLSKSGATEVTVAEAKTALGLGTAAYTNSTAYATAAQGAKADSAVQANAAITGATKCKITYDAKGLVTAGADLAASDIPALDAAKITTGTFADARIASASKWNGKQDALTFNTTPSTTNKVATMTDVNNAVAGKNVTAEGDTYVSASAVSNKVTVAATQTTKNAVDYANSLKAGSENTLSVGTIDIDLDVIKVDDHSNKAEFSAFDVKIFEDKTSATPTVSLKALNADVKGLIEDLEWDEF